MWEVINRIKTATQGERAFNTVREISRYHRIQASPGYRAAADWVAQHLSEAGIQVQIRSYPAKADEWHFQAKMFQEWDCEGGELWLSSPEEKKLADFDQAPLSICPRSYGMDFMDSPVDIVLMDKGADPAAYAGLMAEGALLFIRGHVNDYVDWAIRQTGAIGFISDYLGEMSPVRERDAFGDALNYTSFWWKHTENEPKVGGFVLNPETGDWLAELCRKTAQEHAADPSKPAYPQAKGYINAHLYDGEIEVVEAFLPGERDQEILITAHLCHPCPSANDNASGVAAGMEALMVLHELIEKGELKPLERGIRVIFMPEFTGTYAWLDDISLEGRQKIKAGLNLDMVGARQGWGYGPLTLSRLPHALPSLAWDMALYVMDQIKKDGPRITDDLYVSMVNVMQASFEGGSDNFILSDPTIKIPTPMLGQWPDLSYHTSKDTIDNIDPYVLGKSSAFAAAYAYCLANLQTGSIPKLLIRGRQDYLQKSYRHRYDLIENRQDSQQIYRKAWKCYEWRIASNTAYLDFFEEERDEIEDTVFDENQWLDQLTDGELERFINDYYPDFVLIPSPPHQVYDYVPKRNYIGPICRMADQIGDDLQKAEDYKALRKIPKEKLISFWNIEALIQYYIDGKRTVWEIAEEVRSETSEGSPELVHAYVQFLITLGLVEVVSE